MNYAIGHNEFVLPNRADALDILFAPRIALIAEIKDFSKMTANSFDGGVISLREIPKSWLRQEKCEKLERYRRDRKVQ